MHRFLSSTALLISLAGAASADAFRVLPYLQNPSQDSMTIMWLSEAATPGELVAKSGDYSVTLTSTPRRAGELAYHPTEVEKHFGGNAPAAPYIHQITLTGLSTGTAYQYFVTQDGETHSASFVTAPKADGAVRFIVYADSETEPESTGKTRRWSEPRGDYNRQYPVDQTTGYRQNVMIMQESRPDFVAIAGDLVESGNEQRDWDEFWAHNAGRFSTLASSVPILPALGNHENYPGPDGGGTYGNEYGAQAIDRYQAYFDVPDNGASHPAHEDRYYRVDYGPVTFITVDSSNGLPDGSDKDTNFHLDGLGEDRAPDAPGVGEAPDFNPGSEQYAWLEAQLDDASTKGQMIFVQFHHVPYSVGPHGFPTGTEGQENGQDKQSGVPMQVLSPLFEKFGVAAVFSGHDEMYEHSIVGGVHYFDVGIGGDGLRGPYFGEDGKFAVMPEGNPHQVFLAHLDAPEVWDGARLVSGGKHYGHMQVNVYPSQGSDRMIAELTPVIVFPVMDADGTITSWERRTYDDVTLIQK